jgi:peroxiredoxin
MKGFKLFSAAAAVVLISSAFISAPIRPELELGSALPMADVKMMDVSGKEFSLADSKAENGLLVIFSCNTCPYVKLSESRIKELSAIAKKNKIGMILINSNEAQRDADDSFEAMKKYAASQSYDFHYVLDKGSAVADAFGATKTPHCFLFDKKSLVYRGAIDDNIKDPKDAKEHFLKDALNAVGLGSAVKVASTKSVGCTIKRIEE